MLRALLHLPSGTSIHSVQTVLGTYSVDFLVEHPDIDNEGVYDIYYPRITPSFKLDENDVPVFTRWD
jgi:hypothetical protein